MEYRKFEKLSLKHHPELSERWVQDRIAEDPTILGLGDVILKIKNAYSLEQGALTFYCRTLIPVADMRSRSSWGLRTKVILYEQLNTGILRGRGIPSTITDPGRAHV